MSFTISPVMLCSWRQTADRQAQAEDNLTNMKTRKKIVSIRSYNAQEQPLQLYKLLFTGAL